MTKEDIAKKYVPCRCDTIYTSRNLTAPDCPYHSTDPESAMDEYAKQQAIAFGAFRDNFQWEERKRVREEEKRLGGMITWIGASDEYIYNQFIEQQTKQ